MKANKEFSIDLAMLLTVKDVAEMLQLSTRTVWRMSERGEIPTPVNLGRCVRWNCAEIMAWIGSGCKHLKTPRPE